MTYELCKKLKDAGWKSFEGVDDFSLEYQDSIISLSELIEACGGKNMRLMADNLGNWSATSFIHAKNGEGEIPEEAVVYLFIELNKKKL